MRIASLSTALLAIAMIAAAAPAAPAQHTFGPPELATPIAAAADGVTAVTAPSATPDTAVLVTVLNEMYADAAIYLVRSNTPGGRVATITGHDHGTFALSRAQALAGSDISFLVHFIGASSRPLQTDNISPAAGDHYTITLGPLPNVTFTAMADGDVALEPPNTGPACAPARDGKLRYASGSKRGRLCRHTGVLEAFQRTHPCPSTHKTSGACPGFVKDHRIPLSCARPREDLDVVSNLQWQSAAAGKAKDRWELDCARARRAAQ